MKMQTSYHTHHSKNGTSGYLPINEQASDWEKLPAAEQPAPNFLKYQNQGCELKKFGNFWYKKCTGSPGTSGTAGTAGSSGTAGNGLNIPPIDLGDWTWKEVAYDTYQMLKKAGKWVKEEGGKVYAYLNSAFQAKDADENTWDCINKYNENWGYYKLLRGAGGDFNYEYSTMKINGEKTIFVYFKDGRFVIRGFDSDKDIPGEAGKWSCLEGGGYRLDYDDGRKGVFGLTQKEPLQQSGTGGQNDGQSQQPKPITSACKSLTSCPTFVDFVNKNLAYKVCMKCPEIQNFQNNPVLKIIYFKKLKENNLPQKTDEIFGPIMKSAVEEYQEMNGIQKTGAIGHKTFVALKKDSKGRGA